MNKLFTIALAAMISLFLTTSVVGQERHDRRHRGAEHSKKANAEKSNAECGVKACKCVCHKSKAKATPKRRGDSRRGRGRGRTERGRGRSGRMENLLKRFRQHRAESGGRAFSWR